MTIWRDGCGDSAHKMHGHMCGHSSEHLGESHGSSPVTTLRFCSIVSIFLVLSSKDRVM